MENTGEYWRYFINMLTTRAFFDNYSRGLENFFLLIKYWADLYLFFEVKKFEDSNSVFITDLWDKKNVALTKQT